jgi:hypothetical protein
MLASLKIILLGTRLSQSSNIPPLRESAAYDRRREPFFQLGVLLGLRSISLHGAEKENGNRDPSPRLAGLTIIAPTAAYSSIAHGGVLFSYSSPGFSKHIPNEPGAPTGTNLRQSGKCELKKARSSHHPPTQPGSHSEPRARSTPG